MFNKIKLYTLTLFVFYSFSLYAQDSSVSQNEKSTESESLVPSPVDTTPIEDNLNINNEVDIANPNKSVFKVNTSFFSNGNLTFATSKAKVRLLASDPISVVKKIEYRMDESIEYLPYTTPLSLDKEGGHQIRYRSLDLVGNVEFENVVTVVIDNTAPIVSTLLSRPFININNKNYLSSKESTKISFSAIDEFSGVKGIEYSINGNPYRAYSTPIALDTPENKTILIRAMDNLGNLSEPVKIDVNVDLNLPECMISLEDEVITSEDKQYTLKTNKFVLSATDADSGIASILFRFDDNETFQEYTQPIVLTTEGKHFIEAMSVDKVGNQSLVVRKQIIVDIEAPQSTLEFFNEE